MQENKDKYNPNMAKVHIHNKITFPTDKTLSVFRGNKTAISCILMAFLAWHYNNIDKLSFDAMFICFVVILLFACLKDFLDRTV